MSSSTSNINNPSTVAAPLSVAQSSQGAQVSPSSTTIQDLPKYVIQDIFNFLLVQDLGRCAFVCKNWNETWKDVVVSNPLKLEWYLRENKLLNVIDEKVWETYVDLSEHGLFIEDSSILDMKAILPIVKEMLALPTQKIDGKKAGVTVLTIPEGLTLNTLKEIGKKPKLGNVTSFFSSLKDIFLTYGKTQVNKTYQVVITNNFVEGTDRDGNGSWMDVDPSVPKDVKKHFSQITFLSTHGCMMPSLVEAVTLAFMIHISSGTALLHPGDDNRKFSVYESITTYPHRFNTILCISRLSKENPCFTLYHTYPNQTLVSLAVRKLSLDLAATGNS